MRKYICLFGVVLFMGCSFKEPDKQAEVGGAVAKVEGPKTYVEVSWKGADGGDKVAKRALVSSGTDYASDSPITIGAGIPSELKVSFTLPTATPDTVFRARFESSQTKFDLNVKLSPGVDQSSQSVVALGLPAVLSPKVGITGKLIFEGSSLGKKVFGAVVLIRTPTSLVVSESMAPSEWLKRQEGTRDSNLQVSVRNKNFNLIRVISFKSSDEVPVLISVPRRPKLVIKQFEKGLSYRGRNCGYDIDQNPYYRDLSRDVVILPLDSRLLTEALNSAKDQDLNDSIETKLNKDESVDYGVYAVGSDVDSWSVNGPKGSDLQGMNVVSGCHQGGCANTECTGGPGGGPKDLESAPEMHILICRCTDWHTVEDHANISVGLERGEVDLSGDKEVTASVSYSDQASALELESRVIQILSKTVALEK